MYSGAFDSIPFCAKQNNSLHSSPTLIYSYILMMYIALYLQHIVRIPNVFDRNRIQNVSKTLNSTLNAF
jgi:hypothetical protein